MFWVFLSLFYSSFKCVRKFKFCISPLVKRYPVIYSDYIVTKHVNILVYQTWYNLVDNLPWIRIMFYFIYIALVFKCRVNSDCVVCPEPVAMRYIPPKYRPWSELTDATAAAIVGHFTYTLPCVEALSTNMCRTPPCLLHSSITSSRISWSQLVLDSLKIKQKMNCREYSDSKRMRKLPFLVLMFYG